MIDVLRLIIEGEVADIELTVSVVFTPGYPQNQTICVYIHSKLVINQRRVVDICCTANNRIRV